MIALFKRLWSGEPVFVLTFIATIVPLVTSGVVVFDIWSPSADQLAWVNGVPVMFAAAFGLQVTRQKVAPVQESVEG